MCNKRVGYFYAVLLLIFLGACIPEGKKGIDTKKVPESIGASESSNEHLKKIDDNLFTAQSTTKDGTPIYFGFEKIDDGNRLFWEAYRTSATDMADKLRTLLRLIRKNNTEKYRATIKTVFSYNDAQFDALVEMIKNNPKNIGEGEDNGLYKLFSGMVGGFSGMDLERNKEKRQFYIIYASSVPITRRHTNADFDVNKSLEENFGNIIMSMSGITAANALTTTHTGISRNPLDFLKKDQKYAVISMKLHGFGALVWKKFFENKRYMITQPLESMADILKTKIDAKHIWIDTYPDELKELEKSGIDFDFSYPTLGAQKTTVDLKSLATFFD